MALVEQGDFCSATSQSSSKLAHGGLRYLENGDFGLVFEACQERGRLAKLAPQYVKPTQFIFPYYSYQTTPKFMVKLGMYLYDFLSIGQSLGFHRSYSKAKILEMEPNLNDDQLTGASVYYDARMDDARLAIEVALHAKKLGAKMMNYVKAVEHQEPKKQGDLVSVRVKDILTGKLTEVRTRLVINATGPFTKLTLQLCNRPNPGLV